MAPAPRFTIREIGLYERATPFRKPFRFGAVTVEGTAQAFIRAEIALEDGRTATGQAAELMVPKWFDKNPDLSTAETVDELRHSLTVARETYLAAGAPRTAFAHHAAAYEAQIARCTAEGMP